MTDNPVLLTEEGLAKLEKELEHLKNAAYIYCVKADMMSNWIDIILESDHIHLELQPKRP